MSSSEAKPLMRGSRSFPGRDLKCIEELGGQSRSATHIKDSKLHVHEDTLSGGSGGFRK